MAASAFRYLSASAVGGVKGIRFIRSLLYDNVYCIILTCACLMAQVTLTYTDFGIPDYPQKSSPAGGRDWDPG
jgi:hypothetical protein